MRRSLYGARSERKERLIGQLEMQFEEDEADATENELAVGRTAPRPLLNPSSATGWRESRFPSICRASAL